MLAKQPLLPLDLTSYYILRRQRHAFFLWSLVSSRCSPWSDERRGFAVDVGIPPETGMIYTRGGASLCKYVGFGFACCSPALSLRVSPTKQHGKVLFQSHREEAVPAAYSKTGERFPATQEGHRQWQVKRCYFFVPLEPALGQNH